MNPALLEKLQSVALAASAAGHGKKSRVYQAAADELGISKQTLQKKLRDITMDSRRKTRADAGKCSLSRDELRIISGYLMSSYRNLGKKLSSVENALEVLRANGQVKAERMDKATGEIVPLSVSAVSRALTANNLHPKQLERPTPKTQLASRHPNHVWQIDPSLCVLYYLPTKKGEALQVMGEKEFYKNKPANIAKIEKERVWRYVITDHSSGWIYVHYVLGAESGKNLCTAFINAMQKRHNQDPVHGVPKVVMVDPGSANTGAVFKSLCWALDIVVQVNKPGQPWAKGQVENANNIVECNFEHRLRFLETPPTSLDEINNHAWAWMRWFNATQQHRRTKDTRFNVWLKITADQLLIAPPAEVLRELAVSAPETRKVTAFMEISFKGKTYSVANIPTAMVGETVMVTRNPWRDDNSAQVIYTNESGHKVTQVIEAQVVDDFGFSVDAAMIGEEFKSKRDTAIDTERKAVERLVMHAKTDEEAEANRKAKAVPFNGSIDPMKPIKDAELADNYIPKRGTEMDIIIPRVDAKILPLVSAAKKIADKMGKGWQGAVHFSRLKEHHPEGIAEDKIDAAIQMLQQTDAPAPLRLIN